MRTHSQSVFASENQALPPLAIIVSMLPVKQD